MPSAAERHGKPRRFALRQHQRRAGLRDPRAEPARADAVEQRHRRHVERQLQRAARRHRALERQVEILRRIGAVAHRPVLDQRFRMRDPVLEGEPVDERLQRRARRAQRVGHVDLAGAAVRRNNRPRRRGPAPRRWRCRPRRWRPRDWGRARGRARAPGPRDFSATLRRWSDDAASASALPQPPGRRHAAPAPASDAARSAPRSRLA